MVISYEYAIETTYPTPEAFGASILNVVVYIFAIIFIVALDIIFEQLGYLAGFIVISILAGLGTFSILFVSPQLKRQNANLLAEESRSQAE